MTEKKEYICNLLFSNGENSHFYTEDDPSEIIDLVAERGNELVFFECSRTEVKALIRKSELVMFSLREVSS